MLRFPPFGHHIVTRNSDGGVRCGSGGDSGCGASSAMGEMPLVAAESGGGGGASAESA